MKLAVIIPAAGSSKRFGKRDKLGEDIGGRPLLMRTVEFFTKREEVVQIIVVGPSNKMDTFKDRFGPALSFHGVVIVDGSQERWESVRNALQFVKEGIDRIAIHDAARPGISDDLFDKLLLASRELDAVATAMPITGTVKRTTGDQRNIGEEEDIADAIFGETGKANVEVFQVEQTIDRSHLWEMQTPQIFSVDLLMRAYNNTSIQHPTDDAQLIEAIGEVVYLVEGESRNIKVTTPKDLKQIKAILGVKNAPQRPTHKRF